MFIFDYSGFHLEIELHHFCERENKADLDDGSIAPHLTRMFLSAPLFLTLHQFMIVKKQARTVAGRLQPLLLLFYSFQSYHRLPACDYNIVFGNGIDGKGQRVCEQVAGHIQLVCIAILV